MLPGSPPDPPAPGPGAENGLGGVGTAVQHHGKELSYNNYLDADAAYSAGRFGWAWVGGLGGT